MKPLTAAGDRRETPAPLEMLIDLCRYFCLCDQVVSLELSLTDRAVQLAELAFRHHHPQHGRPSAEQLQGLRRAFQDGRVRALHPRQRLLLLFVTGSALGGLEVDAPGARALVQQALSISRLTFQASPWQPWEGPPLERVPRRSIQLWEEAGHLENEGIDPSGDPIEVDGPAMLEAPGLASHEGEFVHISQVLEGINRWEAVVQERFEWSLGTFSRTGTPALPATSAMEIGAWPEEIREVFSKVA